MLHHAPFLGGIVSTPEKKINTPHTIVKLALSPQGLFLLLAQLWRNHRQGIQKLFQNFL
jgi:hypothetical protein